MANAISYQEIMEELSAPFEVNDIEWRVQSATSKNGGGYRLLVLPYITSRAIMKRLDKVVGPFWKDQYEPVLVQSAPALRCILSLKIGDEWISREDAAELSDIEPIKGGYSNALKRCATKWGPGRYLYNLPQYWVDLQNNGEHRVYGNFKVNGKQLKLQGYFNTPKLPNWALPKGANSNNNSSNSSRNQGQQQNPNKNNNQQQRQAPNNNSNNQQQRQAPNNNSNQQRPQLQKNNNSQQPSNTIPMNESEAERQSKSLARVTGHLEYLGVPLNLVPQLLEQSSGANVPFEQASATDLGKLYHLLNPTKVYVENCTQLGLDVEGMLYYANITLAPFIKRPIENVYALPFYMTVDLARSALALAKEEQTASNQQQVG